MKHQDTNEFRTVRGNESGKNKVFLTVSAIAIALLAIVAAVMLSVIMNMKNGSDPTPSPETSDTVLAPPETTAPPVDMTSAPVDTTVSIIPGTDTTASAPSTDAPRTLPRKVNGKFTVCVDPGHGYDDHGAGSEFLGDIKESDITMIIANYVKEYLIGYGYEIVMTHEDNVPPPGTYGQYLFNPRTRIAYVNSNFDYDYYISIHCNSFQHEYVNGTRIYYYAPARTDNSVITSVAECMKAGIAAALPGSNVPTLHPLDAENVYYVCRYSKSLASLLVETGFVTNRSDAEKMLDDTWRKDMAKGIADGVHAYLSGIN